MESHFHGLYPRAEQKDIYLSARGTQGLVISIIFTSLAVFFVLARVYTRAKLIKRMEANDWMIVIALVYNNQGLIYSMLIDEYRCFHSFLCHSS